jgi:hypothetical protein
LPGKFNSDSGITLFNAFIIKSNFFTTKPPKKSFDTHYEKISIPKALVFSGTPALEWSMKIRTAKFHGIPAHEIPFRKHEFS